MEKPTSRAYGLSGPFDLFRMSGRVRRGEIFVIGVVLLIIKYALDLAVSRELFHREFSPLMYVSPRVSPIFTAHDPRYLGTLALIALPFLWIGVSLSVRRLRDAGISPFWAGLFFAPFIHFAFFVVLVFLPSAANETAPTPEEGPFRVPGQPLDVQLPAPRLLAVLVPRDKSAAHALALLLSGVIGLVGYIVTRQVSESFGLMFFIGMPFGIGMLVAFMTTYHAHITRRMALWNGVVVHLVLMILLCALGFEGAACIIMCFPLVVCMSMLGGLLGWSLARSNNGDVIATLLMLCLPGLVGFDLASAHVPVPMSVVSRVIIHAPVETVWKNVVSFPPIDEAPDPIFALVAMPVEARIEGQGPGALRRCIFTSGFFEAFEEPIAVWRPPYELTFNVRSQPKSIDDYIDVTRGQFRIKDNGDGTTTLEGETWYAMKLRPVGYFGAWGQLLLHKIHMRVLEHIRNLSEDPDHASHAQASAIPAWMSTSHATCRCTRTANDSPL